MPVAVVPSRCFSHQPQFFVGTGIATDSFAPRRNGTKSSDDCTRAPERSDPASARPWSGWKSGMPSVS